MKEFAFTFSWPNGRLSPHGRFHIDNIDAVSVVKVEKLAKDELKTSVAPLVVEPNVRISLNSSITVTRLFGKRQSVGQIYLFLDKSHEFQAEYDKLKAKRHHSQC